MTSELHVSVDQDIAARASQVLDGLGLTVDDAVRLLLTRLADEERLPFTPNPRTQTAMESARRGDVVRFGSVAALMADLHEGD